MSFSWFPPQRFQLTPASQPLFTVEKKDRTVVVQGESGLDLQVEMQFTDATREWLRNVLQAGDVVGTAGQ